MQLGNILGTAKSPVCCKAVTFHVLADGPDGKQVRARAQAVLAFVDEDKREEYKRLARDYLEAHDYKGKAIPAETLDEEEVRWFLMAALRDKDNEAVQFCPNAEYSRFRKALIMRQISWLVRVYGQFVRDEYSELLSEEQQAQLAQAAAGK